MVNWKKITEAVKEELMDFAAEGYKPTLRAMFYRLYSKELIPSTKVTYGSLVREMVAARWDGRLRMDCFADNSREAIEDFNEKYWTPQDLISNRIEALLYTERDYWDYIPRWAHRQPYWTSSSTRI